jgi:hypothetical protein
VFYIYAIQHDCVKMRMEPQIRAHALDRHYSPTLGLGPSLLGQPPPVPTEHRIDEDSADGSEQFAVVRQSVTQRVRQRQHPLPERNVLRYNMIDKICRGLAHPSAQTTGAKSATFAAKRDQPSLGAFGAFQERKASA